METKKVKTASSQVMELQQLIAGPLIATIEADTLSSQHYLDYLMKIAFESYDPVTGKTGKLRTFTFSYLNQDTQGSRWQSVSIPVLTLVPLPLLQVQEADFDFDIKILDAFSENVDEKFPLKEKECVVNDQGSGLKMRASLAPRQVEGNSGYVVQQSLSSNMKIKVKMRQADMPAGLSNLLRLTASNLQMEEIMDKEEKGGENE